MIVVVLLFVLLLRYSDCKHHGDNEHGHHTTRLYVNQFPVGAEHLILPPILCMSIFYGKIKYPHMNLYFESLRINTRVHYELINIVDDENDKTDILRTIKYFNLSNFHITFITTLQFRQRVKERLNFDIAFNSTWAYKIGTDYKPTLAHLFPEIIDKPLNEGNTPYKYWAYTDIDLIWGNFSRFSHLFLQEYAVITSDYAGASGIAMFFRNNHNDTWLRTLFQTDPLYTLLLQNHTDYQMDEFSRKGLYMQTNIDNFVKNVVPNRGERMNRGIHWKDKLWVEQEQSYFHTGPVLWHQGSLTIVHGSPEFPPGREILIYHRPTKDYNIRKEFSSKVADDIEFDMIKWGYLLPNWIPILTRFICPQEATDWKSTTESLHLYQPYKKDCFARFGPYEDHNFVKTKISSNT